MRFRYTDIQNHQDPRKPFHRPYLIVRLLNGDRHKDVISLVDSGADVCLFHSDIGRMLGIEIEGAPELAFQGVSGVREVAYLHRVDLIVRGLSRSWFMPHSSEKLIRTLTAISATRTPDVNTDEEGSRILDFSYA